MSKSLILRSLLCVTFALSSNAYAQTAQSDFDGDGYSDFTVVSIGNDKSLNWNVVSSGTATQNAMGSFGLSGDHIIMGNWKGTGLPQMGVVTLEDNKNVIWKIKNDQGVEEQRQFGQKKFTVVGGGDFDGDGIADAAIAVLKGKKVNWQISFAMFNAIVGQEKVSKIAFGESGDRIFYASPDGVNDWLATIGKGPTKGVIMRAKNLKNGAVVSSTKFPKYVLQGARPRPFPIKQDNGIDLIGLARQVKNNTQVEIFTFDGVKVGGTTLPGKGDVIAGNFTSAPGEEVAIKTGTGFTVYNHVTGATTTVTTADGVAVDEININNLTVSNSNSGNNGGNNGGETPPSGGNGSCSSIVPWPSSHIYKTRGSDHFTDIRRNTSGVIVKPGGRGPFPSCVTAVDTKGNTLANFGLYARGAGWEARYYAGIGCGGSTPFGGATIAGKARSNTGSQYIYMNFGSVCYGPIDAAKCVGSSSC